MKPLKSLLAGLALLSFVCSAVSVANGGTVPIVLFNTGQDLLDGANDPNYTLTANPDVTGSSPIVQDGTAFPIAAGPWVANTATSKWIGPRFNTADSAAGLYSYATTFLLPAVPSQYMLDTATLSGSWAFDDGVGVGGITLNGNPVQGANPGFSALTPFSVPMNSGFFVAGLNTLVFTGTNGASYTGLLTRDLVGSYATPEPASLAVWSLVGLVLGGASWWRRHRHVS